jgi:peptidoglycan hydrolase CwlO-like protein
MSEAATNTAEYERAERAARLLAEEVKRRKRALRYYLAALAVPVIVGGYVLATSIRAQSEHVADDARRDSVATAVGELTPVAAQLEKLDTILPRLDSAAGQLRSQDRQVRELQERQRAIEARLDAAPAPHTDSVVDAAREMRAAVRALNVVRAQVASQDTIIRNQRVLIQRQADDIRAVQQEQRAIRADIQRLPRVDPNLVNRITRLEARTESLRVNPRAVVPGGVRRPIP